MRLIDCDKLRDELGVEVLMEEVDEDSTIDDIIANVPTVEAIPIEWIEYNIPFQNDEDGNILLSMIDVWRKEHEID